MIHDCPSVYLAGPISHKSYADAQKWRNEMSENLGKVGIATKNPLRGKGLFLAHAPKNEIEKIANDAGITPRQIVTRDIQDIEDTSLLFANLLDVRANQEVPVGTMMEIYHAAAVAKKPVVIAANDLASPWLTFHAIRIVPSIEEAERVIKSYFGMDV